jgi:hypothetical protein
MDLNLLSILNITAQIGTTAAGLAATIGIFNSVRESKARRAEAYRDHARHISVWRSPENEIWDTCFINNSSDDPIYDVAPFYQWNNEEGLPPAPQNPEEGIIYLVISSGIQTLKIGAPSFGGGAIFGVAVCFVDRNGVSWLRNADGKLQELDKHPAEALNISMPICYSTFPE